MGYRACQRCLTMRFGHCFTCDSRPSMARSCAVCRGFKVDLRHMKPMTATELGEPSSRQSWRIYGGFPKAA